MKNIKFRAWDKPLGKYIPWNPFISFDSKEYDIEQCVGLTDKNGHEIYEGDILGNPIASKPVGETFGCVQFEHGCFGVLIDYDNLFFPFSEVTLDDLEVVGNIHENPELFKA
jgi:uncharacterized phage protein (TIGR01671 family)